MSLRDLSVKAKLSLSFGLMGLFLLIVVVMAISTISAQHRRFQVYVDQTSARLRQANDLLDAANARAIAARNLVLATTDADRQMESAAVTKSDQEVVESLAKLKQAVEGTAGVSDDERKQFAEIAAVEAQYGPVARNIVGVALKGQRDEAIDKMNKDCRPLLAKLVSASHAYTNAGGKRAEQEAADAQASFHANRAWMLALSALAFALAGALVWVITNAITRPLAIAVKVAQTVAAGDLSSRIDIDSHDETGQLLTALRDMNSCLIRLVGHVRQSSDSIATGSGQIATGNADLSHRTELQASRLQETAASMSQMNTTVSNNADTARQAASLAEVASQAAQRGGEVVGKVIATMGDISQSSKKIAEIIGVIDGIAFQTNILALNAAVEAARAGDQGRGFAVVAGEVRSLAQRSAGAAREIRALIGSSVDRVEDGSKLVDETGAAMEDIVSQVQRVSSLISEISSATLGQTSDIGAVNGAVSELDQMTQQNAALVEQSAAAAESLRTQAGQLSTLVNQFKLV